MYIVRFGSCCPCGVYIALIPFSLTICEQSCMQLNHRALPQGEDSAVEHFSCFWAGWSPSEPNLPVTGFMCLHWCHRAGPLVFFY